MSELESAMSTYRKILKKKMDMALLENRKHILDVELKSIHSTMSYHFYTTEKDKNEFIKLAQEFVSIYS